MIFSIHIPKTAGTSFQRALSERYGKRLALYYGVLDPKTTEGLRVPADELAVAAARLEERGFEILHGHYRYANVASLTTDPATVWTWLRDPVERTLSHYEFYRRRPLELKPLAERVKAGEVRLAAFAQEPEVRDIQSRFLKGVELSNLGFVGISERFELGLSLLFGDDAPTLKLRYNATERESEAKPAQRAMIARTNVRDMQLYAEGLRLFVDRVAESRAPAAGERPSLLKRLTRPGG